MAITKSVKCYLLLWLLHGAACSEFYKCGWENIWESQNQQALVVPWIATLITNSGVRFCTGTVLNRQSILTAAHCVNRIQISEFAVVLGVSNLSTATANDIFRVDKVIVHPSFLKTGTHTYDNDLAVLKLEIETVRPVQPICFFRLCHKFGVFMNGVSVVGWDVDGTHVVKARPQVTAIEDCSNAWNSPLDTRKVLCRGGGFSQNFCGVDAGSPLVVQTICGNFNLIGVASFAGPTCGDKFPGVYFRVSYYLKWIAEQCGIDELGIIRFDNKSTDKRSHTHVHEF